MHLTPREQERLMIHAACELAKARRARGLRLNYPEAVALITGELLELARDGLSVAELMSAGTRLLGPGDVLPGVAEMIREIQLEATFPDGTKLVTVHEPITPDWEECPGEFIFDGPPVVINAGRPVVELAVLNTADRPVQVGSHYHFFEVNKALEFDRAAAFGFRLDIPSGTAVRFEPGDPKKVRLVAIGGRRIGLGLGGLTDGPMDDGTVRAAALDKARTLGYRGA